MEASFSAASGWKNQNIQNLLCITYKVSNTQLSVERVAIEFPYIIYKVSNTQLSVERVAIEFPYITYKVSNTQLSVERVAIEFP